MTTNRVFALFTAGILCIGFLVGCSSNDAATAPSASSPPSQTSQAEENPSEADSSPGQVTLLVTETSFWPSDDLAYWTYLVLIENANTNFAWLDESFTVEAFDSDGVLLDSDNNYSTLLPQATLALTGRLYDIGSSAITEIVVRASDNGTNTEALGQIGNVTFSEVEWANDRFSAEVFGIATSSFEDDQRNVSIVIVVRGEDGEVVAADTAFIQRLPTGGKARFEATFWDLEITADMTIETYLKL